MPACFISVTNNNDLFTSFKISYFRLSLNKNSFIKQLCCLIYIKERFNYFQISERFKQKVCTTEN